jgi:hypothetical protein
MDLLDEVSHFQMSFAWLTSKCADMRNSCHCSAFRLATKQAVGEFRDHTSPAVGFLWFVAHNSRISNASCCAAASRQPYFCLEQLYHHCTPCSWRNIVARNGRMVKVHFKTTTGYDRCAVPVEADDRSSDNGSYCVSFSHAGSISADQSRSTLATGFVYIGCLINIPVRTQVVNMKGSVAAGLHLLPLMGMCAFGSAFGGAIQSKRNLCSYTLVVASMFVVAGAALLSTLQHSVRIQSRQWAGECLLGLGVGMTLSTVTILTSLKVQMRDHGTSTGTNAVPYSQIQALVKLLLHNPEPWAVFSASLLVRFCSIVASIKTSILA